MTIELSDDIRALLKAGATPRGLVSFVTGAGISAESGIPTYRGEGGLWTDGGIEAMNKATYAWFVRNPEAAWARELQRLEDFGGARPNAAHVAIARLQDERDDFLLITQNIDGLHGIAGSRGKQYIELHGALRSMRCRDGCSGIYPIPGDAIASADGPQCPDCGGRTRPHILWFDEYYDEENYRALTAQRRMGRKSLLVTVGTSGTIPMAVQLARIAARKGAVLVDVNPEDNELRRVAVESGGGFIRAAATEAVPVIVDAVLEICAVQQRTRRDVASE